MEQFKKSFPIIVGIPVAWGDMDAFSHVNNVMYFRYFESARVAYFDRLRIIEDIMEGGDGAILASTQCNYRIPLTYPDTLSVGAKVVEMDDDRFLMKHAAFSHGHNKIAAEGTALLVSYSYRENKKIRLSEDMRKRISEIEGL
ncbi:MAG: acyl-CoA thioesterase [Deltaproteobacteria bacterium]|nr:acyl-CoA thioesterase [Deltaproteobacteria bacterium]